VPRPTSKVHRGRDARRRQARSLPPVLAGRSAVPVPLKGVATRGKLDSEDIWVDAVAAEVWQGKG
jgi:hypothetical protein